VPVIYVGVVFGGGYLIRFLVRFLAGRSKEPFDGEYSEQLQNAGLYIGWLERFMVVTALLLQSPATVGLILTAKSIARYPEFKSERFAEYFLIGTLLSISNRASRRRALGEAHFRTGAILGIRRIAPVLSNEEPSRAASPLLKSEHDLFPVSARLANIRLHPIKSLDPLLVKETRIGPGGGLEFDRAWALYIG